MVAFLKDTMARLTDAIGVVGDLGAHALDRLRRAFGIQLTSQAKSPVKSAPESTLKRPNSLVAPRGRVLPERPTRPLTREEILYRNVLAFIAILVGAFLLNVTVLGGLQHAVAQQKLGNTFREQLALATAPTSEGDSNLVLLPDGAPVAYLEIPQLGIREVVVEGTDSEALALGPGHRRDTVLPGQAGTSVIMGRAAAYGGPFSNIQSLQPGSTFSVVTGQGYHVYKVIGLRYAGDPGPAEPLPDASRLILETARGLPYMPTGIARIDAQMISTSTVYPGSPVSITPTACPSPSLTSTNRPSALSSPAIAKPLASVSPTPGAMVATPVSPSQRLPLCPSPGVSGAISPTSTNTPSATGAVISTPSPATTSRAGTQSAYGFPAAGSSKAFTPGARYTSPNTLPMEHREMATDMTSLSSLVFALQFLLVVEIGSVWMFRRFGAQKAWIVSVPVLVLASVLVSDQLMRLLPNLT